MGEGGIDIPCDTHDIHKALVNNCLHPLSTFSSSRCQTCCVVALGVRMKSNLDIFALFVRMKSNVDIFALGVRMKSNLDIFALGVRIKIKFGYVCPWCHNEIKFGYVCPWCPSAYQPSVLTTRPSRLTGESNLRPSAYQPSALTTRPSRLTTPFVEAGDIDNYSGRVVTGPHVIVQQQVAALP